MTCCCLYCAKYAVELDLANAKKMFDLDYVIFRPHNVYGEFQNIGDKYRNVVGIFMNQILKDIPLTIFGNGDQQRAFSYVGDIIGPIAKAAWTPKAYGQVFNIGADLPLSVKELANSIKKILQKPDLNIKFENERNEVKIAFSDHAKVKLYFGETKTTSLEEGLLKMFQWVNKVGSRESNKFKNIEIRKGLPESWLK